MVLPIVAVIAGLALLVWSADKFVDGAVGVAKFCGMSSLLIGMVVVGFGTSAPEMVVSALSALQGNPELALGNAYGSNIANIALILGVTAIIIPVVVKRIALRRDLPILLAVSGLAFYQLHDGAISRMDAVVLLAVFAGIMLFNILSERAIAKKASAENPIDAVPPDSAKKISLSKSILWLVLGLVLLVASSRMLVWGAVEIARSLGVSDLLIGLTIVAVGTSLPELASSIMAARKGEDDLAVGNILGSNLFNTMAVVGIAGVIAPMDSVDKSVFVRDLPLMLGLTALLFIFGIPFRKLKGGVGRINRFEGIFFVAVYVGYLYLLASQAANV
ncbi:MAG: calcium/sodium antiporter [Fibrobacter sp.]|nr:calcium/sodium antiporter [Fibrobacter sp.]